MSRPRRPGGTAPVRGSLGVHAKRCFPRALAGVTRGSNQRDAGAVAIRASGETLAGAVAGGAGGSGQRVSGRVEERGKGQGEMVRWWSVRMQAAGERVRVGGSSRGQGEGADRDRDR
jgi:hypothetical protein